VAFRTGASAEVVEDGVGGFLVAEGDARGAADALVRLAREPARARAMGEAGRRAVLDRHGPARLARALSDLYARARG
jgi:phosphatidylinositol alpha-1,6-mannosyltransferase